MDTILVDCLLYDDDHLFSAALHLLEITYTQRRRVLRAVEDVTLLQDERLPVVSPSSSASRQVVHYGHCGGGA